MQPVTTIRAPSLRRSESSSATSIDSRRAASMKAHVFTTTRSASAPDPARVLRRRLETASVPVMIEWSGSADDRRGVVLVPEDQSEFAAAVVNEIDVDDEVSDDSPHAYVARVEEHLSAAAGLLEELRTRLDDLEADGRI